MTLLVALEVVLGVCLLASLVGALVFMRRLGALTNELVRISDELKAQVAVLLASASELVDDVNSDVDKFEHLLDSASRVTESMGSATKLAYSAVASPIVRAKALRAGAGKLAGVFKVQSPPKKGARK